MKVLVRVIAILFTFSLLVGGGLGAVDASAFDAHAHSLRAEWAHDEQAGVPATAFAELDTELRALESRHLGPLPYSSVSGSAFVDPFLSLEERTRVIWADQVSSARTSAQAALTLVKQMGVDSATLAADQQELQQASTPAQYQALSQQWSTQAQQLAADRAKRLAEQKRLEAQQLAQQQAQKQKLLDAEANATYLLNQATALLQQYQAFGKPTTQLSQQLNQLQTQLNAAKTPDDANAVANAANQVIAQLNHLIAVAESSIQTQTNGAGCLQNAPAKLIIVHVVSQTLVAYDHGCVYLRSYVTTGRPALPTGQGTFHIFYKAVNYLMRSPWPPGSPYWYPNTWVGYAMEFESDGTFIHTAAWEPSWAYGPGSQYGGFASHGCVHVMDGPAASLYGWAPIGTTVIVEN